METLPVVDFSCLTSVNAPLTSPELDQVSRSLIDAFTTVGFAYITNHGVPQSLVNDIHALGKELFSLPLEQKTRYPLTDNHGYIMMDQEGGSPDSHGELKECFNVTPSVTGVTYPREVDNFEGRVMEFYKNCWKLSDSILLVIARGLGLSDKYFEQSHTYMGKTNQTALRFLHYPPLSETVKPNQMRLDEHTDFGTITLLFQDDVGGLEVLNQSGEWVQATPMQGTVLVNIADLLQRWSGDKLKSTVHRIRIPADDHRRKTSRYSIACFVDPNSDFLVECFDNSHKYPPILVSEFFEQKLNTMKT